MRKIQFNINAKDLLTTSARILVDFTAYKCATTAADLAAFYAPNTATKLATHVGGRIFGAVFAKAADIITVAALSGKC